MPRVIHRWVLFGLLVLSGCDNFADARVANPCPQTVEVRIYRTGSDPGQGTDTLTIPAESSKTFPSKLGVNGSEGTWTVEVIGGGARIGVTAESAPDRDLVTFELPNQACEPSN